MPSNVHQDSSHAAEASESAQVRSVVIQDPVHARMYPEYVAGGFPRDSHFVDFFSRVNALVTENSHVLDFGAGRGKFLETEHGWKLSLASLRERVGKMIGVDVDPVVLNNEMNDENYLISESGEIPLADESVDLVFSWAVFEHINDPVRCSSELNRVLRKGGWICAWTPNKWGLVGMGARMIPNAMHAKILKKIGVDGRKEEDVFPVVYSMNTKSALKKFFPVSEYEHYVSIRNGPPGYHGGSLTIARMMHLYGLVMPAAGRAMLHVFLRKK